MVWDITLELLGDPLASTNIGSSSFIIKLFDADLQLVPGIKYTVIIICN